MIINFSVQNFGSIKDKQTLSFEADKSTHLESTYVVNVGKERILKLALIYGANASGKTTILKALDFLIDLVLRPKSIKTDELDFDPFLFDPNTPTQNSLMSIEFIENKVKYLYEVTFFKKAIVTEELYFYKPNKASIYKRTTNLADQFTKIQFGNKTHKNKTFEKTLEANTLWNNTVLGGYLKTNIDFKELKEVANWFTYYLKSIIYTNTNIEKSVRFKIEMSEISKTDIIGILKKADFNISNIIIEEKEKIDSLLDFLVKSGKMTKDIAQKLKENQMSNGDMNIEFEHTVNGIKYTLPMALESQGTRRYFSFAGLLTVLIKNSTVISIDELESSLHPDLYLHFLLSFLTNAKNSQLIATTHNREILDNKDIFRNDAIWITDKKADCATELYSLADFDSNTIRNTTNVLNAYKSGKLSGTPNLGDVFIDLNP